MERIAAIIIGIISAAMSLIILGAVLYACAFCLSLGWSMGASVLG